LLLESTGEGIFGIDMDGRCTFVNRAAAQMLGWRTEEVLGRNMHELIHHSHADGRHYPECDCPIFNAFRRGLPCRIDDEVLWRADGSSFPAEYSSYPVIEHGQVRARWSPSSTSASASAPRSCCAAANDELERAWPSARAAARPGQPPGDRARDRAHAHRARDPRRAGLAAGGAEDGHSLAGQARGRRRAAAAGQVPGHGRLIDTAVDNVGRIITDLRPSILDHQGLWAALEWQAQEFIESSELDATLQVHVAAGVPPPEGGLAIAVFRIFQEMLSNVARHAQARSVRSASRRRPPEPVLYLDVRDDGVGAPRGPGRPAGSFGVMGMRERAGALRRPLTHRQRARAGHARAAGDAAAGRPPARSEGLP
jgi:PAS domain S-box-containing protein